MPLGTIDRTPPPFFRQGASAVSKLALFSALSLCLMAADARYKLTRPARAVLGTALLPVQRALQVPVDLVSGGSDYAQGLKRALDAQNISRAQMAKLAERAGRTEQLAAENARLRELLGLKPALSVKSVSAEVLYEAGDPYSRKVFIDRGARDAVQLGAPVINETGVLGQVTEVYPLSAVVTLLTDRDAAIPVINTRTQQRGAAFGGAEGGAGLELRFMAANADVQAGDQLATSGVDGVYPPGLLVAKVLKVERRSDAGFARILLAPAAGIDGVRHLLVLEPLTVQMPPKPEPVPDPSAKTAKGKPGAARPAAERASAPAASPSGGAR